MLNPTSGRTKVLHYDCGGATTVVVQAFRPAFVREDRMEIDRRAFLATLGTAAVVEAMPSEALADALEHHMMDTLDEQGAANNELTIRKGAGSIFGAGGPSSGGGRAL